VYQTRRAAKRGRAVIDKTRTPRALRAENRRRHGEAEVTRVRRPLASVLDDLGGLEAARTRRRRALRRGRCSGGSSPIALEPNGSPELSPVQIPLRMQPAAADGGRAGSAQMSRRGRAARKSLCVGLFTTLVRNCAWHSCPEQVIFRTPVSRSERPLEPPPERRAGARGGQASVHDSSAKSRAEVGGRPDMCQRE
jgi:hypothetical protein